MAPKAKVTKDEIIFAAIKLIKENGEQALNARSIAEELACSTQPIFSNFATMKDLRLEIIKKAHALYLKYINREIENNNFPAYKASGMAYIRFASEEKELFKFLYMRDRSLETIPEDAELFDKTADSISQSLNLSIEDAKLFHLEIWACVHGIATMLATGFLKLDWPLISKMLTDAYQGLKKQYKSE